MQLDQVNIADLIKDIPSENQWREFKSRAGFREVMHPLFVFDAPNLSWFKLQIIQEKHGLLKDNQGNSLEPSKDHVHGGLIATLSDQLFAYAFFLALGKRLAVTKRLEIEYLNRAPAEGALYFAAQVEASEDAKMLEGTGVALREDKIIARSKAVFSAPEVVRERLRQQRGVKGPEKTD